MKPSTDRSPCTRRAAMLAPIALVPPFRHAAAQPATPARRIAILSLIGDELSYVSRGMTIGSHLSGNERNVTPVADAAIDDLAVSAAERALAMKMPTAERLRFSIRDKRLFALQERLLEPGSDSDGLRESLQKLLADSQATHLLLITKRRDDARFRLDTRWAGRGKLDGVGFYLDENEPLRSQDSGEVVMGYFGSYAYIAAHLVESATMKKLATAPASETEIWTAHRTDASRPWDALEGKHKVETLQRVIIKAVVSATERVAAA